MTSSQSWSRRTIGEAHQLVRDAKTWHPKDTLVQSYMKEASKGIFGWHRLGIHSNILLVHSIWLQTISVPYSTMKSSAFTGLEDARDPNLIMVALSRSTHGPSIQQAMYDEWKQVPYFVPTKRDVDSHKGQVKGKSPKKFERLPKMMNYHTSRKTRGSAPSTKARRKKSSPFHIPYPRNHSKYATFGNQALSTITINEFH